MRNLISGIFGICFGLMVMCGGGAASTQGGAFKAGTYAGFICGGIFFIVGIPYLILGIMQLVNNSRGRPKKLGRQT